MNTTVARRARLAASLSILVVIVMSLLPAPLTLAPACAQDGCEGLITPRLEIGGSGRVFSTYGVSLKNQAATGAAGGTEVTLMPFGTTFTVLDGPRCNYGYVWWQVRLANGTTGWAAEGDSANYYLEPFTVGLYTYKVLDDGARIRPYFVSLDGYAQAQPSFVIEPVNATPGDGTWQQVEIDALDETLSMVQGNCPDRLKGTIWEHPDSMANPLDVHLPTLEYEYYPSPTGDRLLLIRHLHLNVPNCGTVLPKRIGMSRVSLLSTDGTETVLFPYPQHGGIPDSVDRYEPSEPDPRNVYMDEVVWAPNGKYIAYVVAYKALCEGQGCYHFHMYISNLDIGQLYILGEGRHVGWTNGGEQINFFRLISDAQGNQAPHLYTMRPDGTARQEIWLPGGALYTSAKQTPLDYPWNDSGTRVLVGNAGYEEVMLFNVADRTFGTPVAVPDVMPQVNRLSVNLFRDETELLWATIRGDFVTQDLVYGDWSQLTSAVSTTGIPPVQARPFPGSGKALIEMQDGSAYILDAEADTLEPVTFSD
ncbi:MAG: hypothetical protein JXJ20_08925 [Anaerolineae bacterium]|nr:hypothetical protein [Anaerolineae bacterium]